jgi:amidase
MRAIGFNLDGPSMGIQASGRPRADLDVLRLAWAYEQATSWRAELPAVLG